MASLFTVQYWELGKIDMAEEANITPDELSYTHLSKCFTA